MKHPVLLSWQRKGLAVIGLLGRGTSCIADEESLDHFLIHAVHSSDSRVHGNEEI